MYKPKDDKWKFLIYDFDSELGQDVTMGAGGGPGRSRSSTPSTNIKDIPSYTFAEWTRPRHLIDILILNNSTRFDNILRNFVTKAFNPTVLFPHIDELKEFIRPYVELDKIPDENGKYPGRINERSEDYSLAQWEANSEFTSVSRGRGGQSYGLKYWILAKYRYVCKAYDIECDPVYLDENYEIPIDKEVEAKDPMAQTSKPAATTTVVEPAATTAVEPAATTTAVEPADITTAVEQPTTTIAVEQPTTTKESKTSTRRRKCTVKKSTKSKNYKTKKHHFNKHRHHF